MRYIKGFYLMIGALVLGGVLCVSCVKAAPTEGAERQPAALNIPSPQGDLAGLEELAEAERAAGFSAGMGLLESARREAQGDYAGAVLAAYKELAWAYSGGLIDHAAMQEGLRQLLQSFSEEGVTVAAQAVLAFLSEDWPEAARLLETFVREDEEPDGFGRWMLLVCRLEAGENTQARRAAYASIRARYRSFPEYWGRGARYFQGAVADVYAESCINLAGQGPFAAECRRLLAGRAGLAAGEGEALRTRTELEAIVRRALSQNDPESLSELLPLISLPDNGYTLHAVELLRPLASRADFLQWFAREAGKSSGRRAERLAYIMRG